ncbi:hypothetical protein LOK49_LG02G02919 [Camellia lanceoleosa]|uniref:Uncharacterized protein n=1 Tax=Camellia lanceoleosa TaxID=1840588 RepID=A0ACC0IRE4_9ERIC|nr:hypothetical protein LOK49_LG02G02919 [Camellia lanceoleosa]
MEISTQNSCNWELRGPPLTMGQTHFSQIQHQDGYNWQLFVSRVLKRHNLEIPTILLLHECVEEQVVQKLAHHPHSCAKK